MIVTALLQIRSDSLSRERREAILNQVTDLVTSESLDAAVGFRVMNYLMQLPNATARISSEGKSLYEFAKFLDKKKDLSTSVLSLFQSLVELTLRHVLPNKDQAQNKRYLEDFTRKIPSACKGIPKGHLASLSLIRAVMLVQGNSIMLP